MDDEERRAEHKHNFHKIFYRMPNMAEKLYVYYEERVAKQEKKKKSKGEDNASVNHVIGGDPPKTPSPSSSSISSSSSSHSHHSLHSRYSRFHPSTSKNPLLKLDVKFNFPMFNGEANADKLDNWIRQIEFYHCVQQIEEEETKI
jgi:hypothetical protein